MSSLGEGLKNTFNSVVDRDASVMIHETTELFEQDDLFELASHVVAATRSIEKTSPGSDEAQLIAVAALLLNYFEYKEK